MRVETRNPHHLPTLTRTLMAWALGALLLVWGSLIAFASHTGLHESDELTDEHLASVAALILNLKISESGLASERAPILPPANLSRHDYQQSLSIALRDATGTLTLKLGDSPLPGFVQEEGFSDRLLGQPPQLWRSFSQWDPSRQRKVVVLLSEGDREDLAQDIALQIVGPGLWLLPVVMLVLGLVIRRGLQPLHRLSDEVRAPDAGGTGRLSPAQPLREFDAVVASINGLLEQQQAVLHRERALASHVAHELRTPLASMSLNARSLRGALSPADRERALQ